MLAGVSSVPIPVGRTVGDKLRAGDQKHPPEDERARPPERKARVGEGEEGVGGGEGGYARRHL